jgi:hypothetical protein
MNNFPRMMAFLGDMTQEKMMYDFEDVNAILTEMTDAGVIEPIDENDCHPLDWASVVGVDIFDEVYAEADFFLDK